MIYLVAGYDLPVFPHSADIRILGPELGRSYPSTIPRAKKQKTSKTNICKNMVEGYDLPAPPILQKEALLAKKGGRI